MINLVIIDYGSGNLRSVQKACERALADHNLAGSITVSNDAKALDSATHILLPGVGAYGDCISGLAATPGMLEALTRNVIEKQKWFLGICVGMQLLFDKGYEYGEHDGLGWISGEVTKLKPDDASLKIPHMGWNQLKFPHKPTDENPTTNETHPLLKGISTDDYAYFVHSYHATSVAKKHILATINYGTDVVSVVGKDNIFGTQFHPEKSQAIGLSLLANFMRF